MAHYWIQYDVRTDGCALWLDENGGHTKCVRDAAVFANESLAEARIAELGGTRYRLREMKTVTPLQKLHVSMSDLADLEKITDAD